MNSTNARKIFVNNLKYFMNIKGISQSDISNALNIPLSTISSWYNEASYPRVDKMQALADYFNISMRDLTDIQTSFSHNIRKIDLYNVISCGKGSFVDDNIIDTISLPADLLNPNKEYFAQYAKGDSMIGAHIKDGDLVIFEKTSQVTNGMIGSFCIGEDNATCKRLKVTDKQIILLPENPDYDPILVNAEDFRCVGKLAFVVSNRTRG